MINSSSSVPFLDPPPLPVHKTETMTTVSSLISPLSTTKRLALSTIASKPIIQILKPTTSFNKFSNFTNLRIILNPKNTSRLFAVSELAAARNSSSEAARRLYVGNIPRTVDNEELRKIVEEHGAVEEAEVMYDKYSGKSRRFAFVSMKTVEDANAAIEKLNGMEIAGRKITVNITEKPLPPVDFSLLQREESQFIDSPHKIYVGNLAKTVTTDTLKEFFSKAVKVLSAKVSRVPGTSKSSGFGFVTFSSAEDAEIAISSFNNSSLEGKQIRVNNA